MAHAQQCSPTHPRQSRHPDPAVVIADKPVADKFYVISGEDSGYRTTFESGNLIYINTGAEQGVKVGDQFDVVRPMSDNMAATSWFKYQSSLTHAMGTRYADIGRLRVVHVDAKTSTAEESINCEPFQRGDLVIPFAARPVPQFHDAKLDPFCGAFWKEDGHGGFGQELCGIAERSGQDRLRQSGRAAGRSGWRLFPGVPLSRHDG